jgi:hypothetical protein
MLSTNTQSNKQAHRYLHIFEAEGLKKHCPHDGLFYFSFDIALMQQQQHQQEKLNYLKVS